MPPLVEGLISRTTTAEGRRDSENSEAIRSRDDEVTAARLAVVTIYI